MSSEEKFCLKIILKLLLIEPYLFLLEHVIII